MQRGRREEKEGGSTCRILYLAFCVLLLFLTIACQTLSPPTDTETPATASMLTPSPPATTGVPISPVMANRHRRIFRRVWNTVDRNYVYDDYNGVDWAAIKEEFTPLVQSAPDDETFWTLMQTMIGRLNDRHSVYVTPQEVLEEDKSAGGDLDYVGIGILVAIPEGANYAVIHFPLPGSPAETAGIRPHDRVLSIDGHITCCNDDGSDNLGLIRGPEGTRVRLVVQQPNAPAREVDVVRAHIQSQLPVISRRIDTEGYTIGYLMIPTLWDETISERSREALQTLVNDGPLDGLIIDMRINGGGAYTEMYDLASLFVSGELGRFRRGQSAGEPLTVEADPIANSHSIPLVILVGRDTESFAEIFSGALQASGRATLVGQPTAGNVELIFPYDLEDGSRLWLAEETFEPLHGERWEGAGVQPDILVAGQWEAFTDEDDLQFDTALDTVVQMINKP